MDFQNQSIKFLIEIFKEKLILELILKKNDKFQLNEDSIKSVFSELFPRFVRAEGKDVQITLSKQNPQFEQLKGNKSFILKTSDGLTKSNSVLNVFSPQFFVLLCYFT